MLILNPYSGRLLEAQEMLEVQLEKERADITRVSGWGKFKIGIKKLKIIFSKNLLK